MLLVAACGPLARAARARQCSSGCGRWRAVLHLGSVGGTRARLLAVVRRGRTAALCRQRPPARHAGRGMASQRVRGIVARGRARAMGRHAGSRPRHARAVPAGVARVGAGERSRDSGRHARASCRSHSPASWFRVDTPWTLAHARARAADALARMACPRCRPRRGRQHAPRGVDGRGRRSPACCWLLAPRGVPGGGSARVWLLPMALLPPPACRPGGVRIIVLDVGQGLAVFVATARHALIYDTGPRFGDSTDAGGRIVAPFLRAAGVARLDALVVSHADDDHSGGARVGPAGGSGRDAVCRRCRSTIRSSRKRAGARAASRAACRRRAGMGRRRLRVRCTADRAGVRGSARRKSNDLSCVLRIAIGAAAARC